jgi:hypothetical protein
MIFRIFVTVLFCGFAILLGILGVTRGLYRSSMFQPPDIPGDSAAKVSLELDDGHEHTRQDSSEVAPEHDQRNRALVKSIDLGGHNRASAQGVSISAITIIERYRIPV